MHPQTKFDCQDGIAGACFVRLAQLFILPQAGWQSSYESLVAMFLGAAMTEVFHNLFIPHIVDI